MAGASSSAKAATTAPVRCRRSDAGRLGVNREVFCMVVSIRFESSALWRRDMTGQRHFIATTCSGGSGVVALPLLLLSNRLFVAGPSGLRRRGTGRRQGVHAGSARHRVLVELLAGAGGIAGGDQREDLLVLEGRLAQPPRLGQRVAPEQAQLVDEPAVHLQQLGVAGELDQRVVEAQVGGVIGLVVVAGGGGAEACDEGAQRRQLLGPDRSGELAPGHAVERGAHLEDLIGLGDRDLAHEDAAVLLEPYQPGLGEGAQRFPDRAARHPQARRQRQLVELFAGDQLAFENHALQLALDQHRQRVVLQDRDVCGRLGHPQILGFNCLLSTIFFPRRWKTPPSQPGAGAKKRPPEGGCATAPRLSLPSPASPLRAPAPLMLDESRGGRPWQERRRSRYGEAYRPAWRPR